MAKPTEIEGVAAETSFAEAAASILEARRLRTALEVFEPCFPRSGYERLLKDVKALGDALGERRDRDVAVAALQEFAESIPRPDRPGIASLIERYEAERAEANRSLKPSVARRRLSKIRKRAYGLAADARRETPAASGGVGSQ